VPVVRHANFPVIAVRACWSVNFGPGAPSRSRPATNPVRTSRSAANTACPSLPGIGPPTGPPMTGDIPEKP